MTDHAQIQYVYTCARVHACHAMSYDKNSKVHQGVALHLLFGWNVVWLKDVSACAESSRMKVKTVVTLPQSCSGFYAAVRLPINHALS